MTGDASRDTTGQDSSVSTLTLSPSKGERLGQDSLGSWFGWPALSTLALRPFDRLTVVLSHVEGRQDQGERVEGLTTSGPSDPRTWHLRAARLMLLGSLVVGCFATAGVTGAQSEQQIAAFERALIAAPEDLRVCAEYRQRLIALGDHDRAITLLERLSERPGAGPNVHMSLALAYVDKVPAASPFKRIFLGRDAMRAMSHSIEREPSLVAYYIRGLIALYYPEAVFHRARGGIADLERARGMLPTLPGQPYHARVYVSLGDGYWKIKDMARAVSIWTDGVNHFPENLRLRCNLGNFLDCFFHDGF